MSCARALLADPVLENASCTRHGWYRDRIVLAVLLLRYSKAHAHLHFSLNEKAVLQLLSPEQVQVLQYPLELKLMGVVSANGAKAEVIVPCVNVACDARDGTAGSTPQRLPIYVCRSG